MPSPLLETSHTELPHCCTVSKMVMQESVARYAVEISNEVPQVKEEKSLKL